MREGHDDPGSPDAAPAGPPRTGGRSHGVIRRDQGAGVHVAIREPAGVKVYRPHERPAVEVLVAGAWYPGELRGSWRRFGRQHFTVSWRQGPSLARLDTVSADRVRIVDDRDDDPEEEEASS